MDILLFLFDKMVQTNLAFWPGSLITAKWVLVPLWTEVETPNSAAQFINAIQEAVAQRNEAAQGRVWNTINIFMALSGLLSRMAEGDGMRPSAVMSTARAKEWRLHITLKTTRLLETSSPLVSYV